MSALRNITGYNILHYEALSVTRKQIPNVVYLELLSEDGLIAFAIFLYSLWLAYRRTDKSDVRYIRLGMLSLLVSFLLSPPHFRDACHGVSSTFMIAGRRRSEIIASQMSVPAVGAR